MREIKFRLWDENAKRWISRGESVEMAFSQRFPESISVKAEFYLEQYTGLKDKNGKEIYEGDIVGTYEYYYNEETGEDELGELEPWGAIVYEAPAFGLWGNPIYGDEDKHFFEVTNGMVVIGNIHENPELLEAGL